MDARSFFNKAGTPFPAFRFNQFGGSFGGPVYIPGVYNGKNRTFFFFDYEGYRRSALNTLVTTIPTAAMRAGNFAGINAIFDPLSTVPTGSHLYAHPLSQRSDPAQPLRPGHPEAHQRLSDAADQRADQQLHRQSSRGRRTGIRATCASITSSTPSNNFFARWAFQRTSTFTPNTFPAVQIAGISTPVKLGNEDSFAGTSFSPDQHAVADYVHVFSPSLVNDLRVGFTRFLLDYTQEGFAPGLDARATSSASPTPIPTRCSR